MYKLELNNIHIICTYTSAHTHINKSFSSVFRPKDPLEKVMHTTVY